MSKSKIGPQTWMFPMPAVLVGATVEEKPNFMTAAWCQIAGHQPPMVAVAINKQRYTLKGIEVKKAFSINIPSTELVKKVDYCGIYSGKRKDKSRMFKVFYGAIETAPLIEECPVNLECELKHILELGSHNLIVGEIIETHVNNDCLTDKTVDIKKIDPLIYIPGTQNYHRLGDDIARAFNVGKE
ncbi:MAG: flavin reductase family protein [Deltaproteobacteria bacterium]|nr:flavin reductase family protein [Deltaproteobacteria bacterium]MBW2053223.1 flavin reductase family protein [Deltaproteobacteria bacterium]MBW2140119.1 flavin reductase family protein [Deltaproteobacteria bacterium]MBW2323510.1 flavin reductase family protein [Deltaproteobacteria bacterium]